ncbi:hypothetical protein SEA_TOMAS_37 [Streptomyces phage Tomas]|uniref:Uncharacterized protein n=1 Tax=Streptomyces phage Tomas TaxID=2914443 RepID=A0AA49BRQ4_9CAUD|nr:hypothetical protein PP453_gp037 [Streptomyces phage Tomas]UMO76227.1 hypothetical protein SEA_TOMAS_37 [Streptomyces phage Tomas]
MPDSLGRDKKGENTRSDRGKCYMKGCQTTKNLISTTYYGKAVLLCKRHEDSAKYLK